MMVHPSHILYKDATAIPGMKILTPQGLGKLVTSVRAYGEAVASTTLSNIARLLTGHKLAVGDLEGYLVDVKARIGG